MNEKDLTACCGLYCPDCMWYKNNFSVLAEELMAKLEDADFKQYASVKSPFGRELEHYDKFVDILKFISANDCREPCRKGGGCGGRPCGIMKCAEEKGYEGCWECADFKECKYFDIVRPRCRDTPYKNLLKIKELGYKDWISERGPYYIWQKKE